MRLTFLGGARTVTGSQFLLETSRARVLIDCGMFQGGPNDVARNRIPLAYDPATIDALLLTHAHLDHCGLIPHLAAAGFRRSVYATNGTVELARLVLLDSAKLQEEFARRPPRREPRPQAAGDPEEALRRAPAVVDSHHDEPLYTVHDAERALAQFVGVAYEKEREVAPGVTATFHDAGHILGSAIVRVKADGKTIVFSGDLGPKGTPIIRDPAVCRDADHVVVESTYGGREHEPRDEAVRLLGEAVRATAGRSGVLLVPSFAVGRTQEVVWELNALLARREIPQIGLYLDSPMASRATEIYRRYPAYFDEETAALVAAGDAPLDFPGAQVVSDGKASQALGSAPRPHAIVASNGMLTGGRVVSHFRDLVDDERATVLFVGYQGQGTLGRHLLDGAKVVTIDGRERAVRCEVRAIDGFSAHAGESGLLEWLAAFATGTPRPKQVFIVHGDPPAQAAFAPKVRALGYDAVVPEWKQSFELA